MPFGAEPVGNGQIRFRLWAPAAQQVELCLRNEAGELSLPMEPSPEGWFELTSAQAKAGNQYRYRINGEFCVPDPASRYQPDDVHGYSEILDAESWYWTDKDWTGRPWAEAVIYELHIGTFTPEGTFKAALNRLDHLLALGISAIQLMPLADFPGERNWGYDGVFPFAPDSSYGTPDELKELVQTAHGMGMMVFLDVVYNHFGPEGNYLHHYAPTFFTTKHHTPWGAALHFEGEDSYWVRQFFIHNALYWLEEFHFDGLRLDAVQCIIDDTQPHILEELAEAVHNKIGQYRQVHLILENDHNTARYLTRNNTGKPLYYVAQWNDDIHHALHVLLTGENQGYYADYAEQPDHHLCRCLAEGFAYQGEASIYRHGETRGDSSAHLPPLAFVSFLQNHDQVGNRAFAERITALAPDQAVRSATALLLLLPFPPMLFMGQEWGSRQPFAFFCDFEANLARRVSAGRCREFAKFLGFADPKVQQQIPDPADERTYRQSMLDWETLNTEQGQQWLNFHRNLLNIRRKKIVPRLAGTKSGNAKKCHLIGERAFAAHWRLEDDSMLYLLANLGAAEIPITNKAPGQLLFATPDTLNTQSAKLPGWSIIWTLQEPKRFIQ